MRSSLQSQWNPHEHRAHLQPAATGIQSKIKNREAQFQMKSDLQGDII